MVCRVIDRDSGRPVPARVRLMDEHSNEVVPLGHAPALAEDAQEGDVRFQGRRYSYVDGEFRVDPRRLPLAVPGGEGLRVWHRGRRVECRAGRRRRVHDSALPLVGGGGPGMV